MKYFITGATGFIGGYLTRQLVEAGHEVIALVRSPDKAQILVDLGVTVCRGDILDKESMRAPMTGADGVFHLAAWYKIGARDRRPAQPTNVDGTSNVLALMRELAIPKGVYTSTVAIYSDTRGYLPDETYRYAGPFLNEYERTKWTAYHQVVEPMIEAGLPLVVVIPGVVYGPGDNSLLHDIIIQYLKRRLPFAPQQTALSWAHVADTAHGIVLAMDQGVPGESYILTGEVCSFLRVLEIGEELTGIRGPRLHLSPTMFKLLARLMGIVEKIIPLPPLYSSEALRTIAGTTYIGSSAKAERDLGFAPRPLVDGLRELAAYEMAQLGLTG